MRASTSPVGIVSGPTNRLPHATPRRYAVTEGRDAANF